MIDQIRKAVRAVRWQIDNEADLQSQLETIFTNAGIPFKREVKLSDKDRVDFMFPDGLALEVKFECPASAIYRQLQRYCLSERVSTVMLIAPRVPTLPPTLAGKPVTGESLWRLMI